MAPPKVSKMKQVCAASPGKFASALLDILDGSVEDDPVSPLPVAEEPTLEKKVVTRKRPAAAMVADEDVPARKKRRQSKDTAREATPAKITAKDQKIARNALAMQRRKELKTLKLARIKDMVVRNGLDVGSKEKNDREHRRS